MFSKYGMSKPKGSMTSSKTFKYASTPLTVNNSYTPGSGVGASNIAGSRAKNRRAFDNTIINQSFSVYVPPPPIPLAPVITSITSKTLNEITFSFTQSANDATITNYKYSIDNGATYTAFSPVKITSPLTITGLSSGTSYTISIKAVSVNGDGEPSNKINESTYTQVNYDSFTNVGDHTWTSPSGVTEIEYLIVGGGGGGGGTYSKITVLGNVLVTGTVQAAGTYWINTNSLDSSRIRGRLYNGTPTIARTFTTEPIQLTASQNYTFTSGIVTRRWYNVEMVYDASTNNPVSINTSYITPPIDSSNLSVYANNVSAGSGGGGGGYILTSAINPLSKYNVSPGTTYDLYVGAGGVGGVASTNSESAGSPGQSSHFNHTLVAPGGDGGYPSRNGFNQNGGGGCIRLSDTSYNIMGGKGGAGGGRNGGSVINSAEYQQNSTINGTYGGVGAYLNFDGAGALFYGAGGDGGDSNTPSTLATPNNLGKGGKGTGATLNSYYSGRDGGSGIVIIKYYT